MNRRSPVSFVQGVLAFLGALVAMFVYHEKTAYGMVPCVLGYHGCQDVVTGPYSHIGPIDLSLFGGVAYITILLLSIVKGTASDEKLVAPIQWVLLAMTLFGFIFSWYLQWLAKYVIRDFCIYCRTSAFIMTFLFVTSVADWVIAARNRKAPANPESTDTSIKTI